MSYKKIYEHYEKCFDLHGDTHLGVDWPKEDDVHKRFDVMLNIIKNKNEISTVLDFGCGCGHLLEYINNNDMNIDYYGLDISSKFTELCIKKFPENKFYNVDILKENIEDLPNFDYIILNGVFTEKKNLTNDEMFNFFSSVLSKLYQKVNIGITFNVMCPIVDFKNDDLFYLSYDKLGLFLKNNLSRHYVINNNYELWEYTVQVFK